VTAPDPGRLLVLGIPGPTLERPEREVLEVIQPGGVILFGRNVASVSQVRELTEVVRAVVPEVLLFVDEEGGRVDRFRELLGRAPAARSLAAAPPRRAEQAGRWIGHSVRALGLDATFAPVVDLDHGIVGNALDGRCLGVGTRGVTARGRAFLRGLHGAGAGGCVKHFPGLGPAPADTHHGPAVVDAAGETRREDLEPFRALAPIAGAVMISHAVYPAYDRTGRPASLSPVVVGGLLRDELGFDGWIVSDDLDMGALAPWGDVIERVVQGVMAGCDALAVCRSWQEALRAVERLRAEVSPARVRESLARWEAYRGRLRELRVGSRRYGVGTIRRRLAGLREAVGKTTAAGDPTRHA